MEKLIMLIDIYEEEVVGVHSVGDKITDKEVARIISKQFGFIKRLVDNDKIDLRKLRKIKNAGGTYFEILLANKSTRYLGLLMLLAISENPIEDLISYLK